MEYISEQHQISNHSYVNLYEAAIYSFYRGIQLWNILEPSQSACSYYYIIACQPNDSTETGLSPTLNPVLTGGEIAPDEDLLLSTKCFQQALSEAGTEVALWGNIDQPIVLKPGQIISIAR